ncbi:MAG TPA: NIPSNAP family protein [Steroidobacteraceae bacterium]|nr:NIPSNAP family protein [Steroidobacteraceae bacterium]
MHRYCLALCTLLVASSPVLAAGQPGPGCTGAGTTDDTAQLGHFDVIELRRYPITPGKRPEFAKYFEAWFPAAFEQLGVLVFGDFFERGAHYNFTWIRGFNTVQDHAIAQAEFYYGPVWREHKAKANSLLPGVDDNVLELHALNAQTEVPALPAVDPVAEPEGARGVVVAEIYSVKQGDIQPFSERALQAFSRYEVPGVRPAGVLVTLDGPNNFPLLPFRTDGPYLVALHILRDQSVLEKTFDPLLARAKGELEASGMLRRAPEVLVLDPAKQSRLRWLPACK